MMPALLPFLVLLQQIGQLLSRALRHLAAAVPIENGEHRAAVAVKVRLADVRILLLHPPTLHLGDDSLAAVVGALLAHRDRHRLRQTAAHLLPLAHTRLLTTTRSRQE